MSKKVLVNLDMNQNEIQNPVAHNLASAPSNPVKGQEYFNTADNQKYIWNGSAWISETAQGTTYQAGTGIDSTSLAAGTIAVSTTVASKTDIGSANLTIQRNGTGIGTFSANATSPTTVNISVPTTATDIGAVPTSRTINGKSLTANVTLTAADVSALPDSTVIGDGKTIFKKNGTAFATITANQTGTINVNYTIPTAVTDLSDASNYALKSDVASAVIPKGSISAVSGLPTLVADHRGWMYNFSAEFTTTSDFVEGSGKKYPAGTNVVVVEYTTGTYKYDVFAGFVDTTTYDNHIANTTIHVTSTDKSTWNGKQDAISDLASIRANATAGAGAASTISGYGNIVTHNTSEFATSAQGAKADTAAQVYSVSNPALTQSGGVCTWTVTHNLGTRDVEVKVYEISSWEEVVTSVALTSTSAVTVKLNSTSNISAATYQVVVAGH